MTVYMGEEILHGWVFAVIDEETGCYVMKFFTRDYVEANGDDDIYTLLERQLADKVVAEREQLLIEQTQLAA